IINHTIETQGYAAGFNQLLELKKAGAAGGTDVKVQLPSEQAEEKLHVAQLANGQRADIQQTWDQSVARATKGGCARPAGGKGAETVNNLLAWVGWDDPLVTSLQKQVSNYNQTQVRLTAGLNQTEMEMLRAQGYLLNNQVPWSQFQETLDLNKRWAATDYDTRWVQQAIRAGAVGGGVGGGKGRGVVPPPVDVEKPPLPGVPSGKGKAATENKTGLSGPGDTGKQNLDEVNRRIKELRDKNKQRAPQPQQP